MADDSLSPAQRAAVPILAGGGTQAQAAAAADRTPRTVRRWLDEPAFRRAVSDATAEQFRTSLAILAGGAPPAARYLCDVARGTEAPDRHRVNAARLVLTLGQQQREAVEFDERIAALEAAHAQTELRRIG